MWADRLVIALVLTSALPAVAQEEPAPSAEQAARFEQAKAFFENGKLAYDLGRFAEAASQFERAYALRPAPLLLFNMAQCHRQLGDAQRAVLLYETFLRESPDEESAQVVIAHEELDKLKAALAAADEEEEARARAAQQASAPKARASEPGVPQGEAALDDGDDTLLWGAVGGGAALVAVAVGVTAVTLAVLASAPQPGDAGRIDFR